MLADLRAGPIETHLLADDIQQIEQSLQTCRRIFGGMLAMARGSGQKIGEGSITRAIESTLPILKDSFRRQAIHLDLDLSDNLPVVKGGQGDLEQLLLNLMTNARDAMPTGGTLSLQTRPFSDGVEVLIQDSGCGIPSEHLSRIHEPFFTTKHNGNGLGLSICRSIVWDMRGDLRISSREGKGTQVRVLLPAVKERDPGAET